MAEARTLGLPQYRTFQLQPGLARLERHVEFLIGAPELALERQLPAAVEVSFLLTRRALLREASAFFVALAFPLLLAPVSFSQLFWIFVRFLSREISSSPLSVLVWACGAALICGKRSARVSREALAMQWVPFRRQIFLCLLCVWRLDSAIFLESQKRPLRFAIFHSLISPLESRWALRLAWQTRLHRYA
jgi:hypothetical protein